MHLRGIRHTDHHAVHIDVVYRAVKSLRLAATFNARRLHVTHECANFWQEELIVSGGCDDEIPDVSACSDSIRLTAVCSNCRIARHLR